MLLDPSSLLRKLTAILFMYQLDITILPCVFDALTLPCVLGIWWLLACETREIEAFGERFVIV